MKLFCLPHLGGSASIYYQWKKYLNEKIEIVPIELAGRGERIKECFYEDFSTLISDVSEKISIEENEKYAFFGHSMGVQTAVFSGHSGRFLRPVWAIFRGQLLGTQRSKFCSAR